MSVLVTGASRGIGRTIALHLAETHDVAVNYHTSADAAGSVVTEAEQRGATAVALQADVRDSAAVDDLLAEAADALGGLDAIVNNAGIIRPARVTDLSDEDWQAVVETNLTGAFYVARAAVPYLRENGEEGGDIISISSIGGTGGTVDASYAASKSGLHGLTRALAREAGPENIQVNAIAPGPVTTEMNDEIVAYLEETDFHGHENIDTHLPTYACDPAEIAETVEYLLKNEFIHGEIINVNGGMQFR
jgi:3-oxoacyl-[acyl-carrier protein] reductase